MRRYELQDTAVLKEKPKAADVPWTIRDVWWGVGSLAAWVAVFVFLSLLVKAAGLDINPGLFVGLAELVLLVPVWWLALRKYGVGWDVLGVRGFSTAVLALGCGLMILSLLFNLVLGSFLALFDLRMQVDLVAVFAELDSPWWLLLAGIVVAPVVEEVFFRGFVFAGLAKRYGWRVGAVGSSFLFALIHFQPLAILPIFVLGLIFAYLYYRSRSIWPAVLMHVATNALGLGAAYIVAETGITSSGF
jgi:membrane protease YdiL (CAAX protease family)